ncbi:unnamed protein product, partial [Closterium sp. NIES-53]
VAAPSQVLTAASGSGPESALLVSPPVPPDSSLAPPPWSPLPASSSRHGLPCPCLWSPPVPPPPSSGACPHLRPLRRGAAARCPSLLRVSSDRGSTADSSHGRVLAAASGSGPESAPCSCRLLSHQTLLWHHRRGHPSLPRLRGMASRVLVSGLPRSLPPLPPGPAPTCVPCVEGRRRAAPHSSVFPPTEAPLQTLHMDVWGPARVRGQGHERYFLLVVDDYSRYTTVFPLRSKGAVTEVLIDWIRAARLRLRESFGSDFPVLRLHSDRGGEFSSALQGAFCRAQGIRQTFTLPASPQQNGIAERRIGMSSTQRISLTFSPGSPCQRPPPPYCGRGRLAMCLRFGSGDLGHLSATCLRTSCPPVLYPASSLASLLTRLGGSFTTPPRAVFCPPRTSPLTSRCLTTVSSPTALRLSPRRHSSLHPVLPR